MPDTKVNFWSIRGGPWKASVAELQKAASQPCRFQTYDDSERKINESRIY